MPPFQTGSSRKTSTSATLEVQKPEEESETMAAMMQQKGHTFTRSRKSARLAAMVDSLQESMKLMIEQREFYAQRSRDLEDALKESAPKSLSKTINIRTMQIADIMMELEDVHERAEDLEESVRVLQEEKDEQKNSFENHVRLLEKQLEMIEVQSKARQERMLADLKEANEESESLQESYRSIRREYANATRNIAVMASKISKLQHENNMIRVEADSNHRALVNLEHQQSGLRSMNNPNESELSLRTQLEASQFENEKLVAERTASQSVIAEMQAHVRMLQTALAQQTRAKNRAESANSTIPKLPDTPEKPPGVATSRSFDSAGSNDFSVSTDATPKQANTSAELEEPVQILRESPQSPTRPKSEPEKARRMPIQINGLEGSYTGPLNDARRPHGTGTIRFKNGDTYLGEMDDGRMHGKGAIYFANKRKPTFRGNFLSDRPVM